MNVKNFTRLMDKTKTRNKKKQNFINAYNEALREHYKLCRYKGN